MGTDKAAMTLRGRPWAGLVADALRGARMSILFAGRAPADAIPGCGSGAWLSDLPDLAKTGPLAGILSAARAEPAADLFVVACDHPALTSDAVEWLLRVAAARPDSAVVGAMLDRPLPTFALYRRAFFATAEASRVRRNHGHSLTRAADDAGAHWEAPPAALAPALASANTPEELAKLRGLSPSRR
ncbi:MAG: NTP transferase domain-containing protein [Myxococcales bacterium]|nr:NTP transferase domain-containing protein [Myxococcales bacterium]